MAARFQISLIRRGRGIFWEVLLEQRARRIGCGGEVFKVDLVMWPTRLLAGSVAKALDIEGSTPQKRREKVLREVALPGRDADELRKRHATRAAVWLAAIFVIFPIWIVLMALMLLILGGHDKASYQVAVTITSIASFFVGAMMCIHVVKLLVAAYLLEDRWNPDSRLWRAVMLAQAPDIVIAVMLAALGALSL